MKAKEKWTLMNTVLEMSSTFIGHIMRREGSKISWQQGKFEAGKGEVDQ